MQAQQSEEVAEDHGVPTRQIVAGLDTLRFATAMWVAFSHGARFPIDRVVQPDTAFDKILLLLGKTTFNGTAAVSVFFVISGFLIHGANLGRSRVDVVPFWIRRGVRIAIPLAAIMLFTHLAGHEYARQLDRVVWSVYAELVYYALYPLLLPLIFRYGTGRVLAVSLAISLAMIAASPASVYLWAFGPELTWLFCAPLWLSGCYLAENRATISRLSDRFPIWLYRCGAVGYCYASTIVATHAGRLVIGYTWTIWLFGMFTVLWLDAEMRRGTGKSTWPILEKFGLAGYSLYLVHKPVITFFVIELRFLPPFAYWLAVLTGIFVCTWLFYRMIEWPAHRLARALGKRRS